MRLSELIGSNVVDEDGRDLGPVRDVRLRRREPPGGNDLEIAGLVVGGGRFAAPAHAWGFAEGRARGPWLLAALFRQAAAQARFIPADRVLEWHSPKVKMAGSADDLISLHKALVG